METFPRGGVFYRLHLNMLVGKVNGEELTAARLVATRQHVSEGDWRKRLADFLQSCERTRAIDRDDIVVDLSSPWPIGVKSRLNCTFNGRNWTMHLDPRLGEDPLKVIHEICVATCFSRSTHDWSTAVWNDDSTHYVVRKDCWRCQFFGTDPSTLMDMMVAVHDNVEKPRGLTTNA